MSAPVIARQFAHILAAKRNLADLLASSGDSPALDFAVMAHTDQVTDTIWQLTAHTPAGVIYDALCMLGRNNFFNLMTQSACPLNEKVPYDNIPLCQAAIKLAFPQRDWEDIEIHARNSSKEDRKYPEQVALDLLEKEINRIFNSKTPDYACLGQFISGGFIIPTVRELILTKLPEEKRLVFALSTVEDLISKLSKDTGLDNNAVTEQWASNGVAAQLALSNMIGLFPGGWNTTDRDARDMPYLLERIGDTLEVSLEEDELGPHRRKIYSAAQFAINMWKDMSVWKNPLLCNPIARLQQIMKERNDAFLRPLLVKDDRPGLKLL